MDPATIFMLIDKGLTLLPLLVQGGVDIANTIGNLKKLSQAGAAGTPISDADLASIEAQFDADLDDFNKPMA
jgi:hypothetical protein